MLGGVGRELLGSGLLTHFSRELLGSDLLTHLD